MTIAVEYKEGDVHSFHNVHIFAMASLSQLVLESDTNTFDIPIGSAKRLVIGDDLREIEIVLAKTEKCFGMSKEVEEQKSVKNARKVRILAKKVGSEKKSGHV